jgi:hypothetical protein
MQIGAAHALVDHVLERHLRIPAHVHAHVGEHHDDAGVLADRPASLRTEARVGEDLGDGIARRRRFLQLVGLAQRVDVVRRMVIGDVLQGVGDAVDEILLPDRFHGSSLNTFG